MKRKIALLMSLVFMLSLLIPANVFAADSDNGLGNALQAVKSIFTIPDSYTEFNYNVNNDGSKTVWYLSWSAKDGADGSMSVNVDDKGTILSYYSYKPYDYNQRRFPKVSRAEAKGKALEFIKKVNPAIIGEIRFVENNQYTPINSDYYFNLIRLVNGIPCPDNSIFISLNSETGEVMNYNFSWTDGLTFPAADKAISMADAQKAYMDKLGLKLVYNQVYDNYTNTARAYAAYIPKFDSTYYIDALTGDKVQLNPYYYGYGAGGAENQVMFDKAKAASTASEAPVQLSPEEIKAIEAVSKLLTKDQAEAKVRAYTELGLTANYKLNNASLSKDWPVQTSFTWNLNFTKEDSDSSKDVVYIGASVDAVTGEIKSFYRNFPYNESDTVKYDEAQSKAAVEKFLQEFVPDKFKNTEFQETNNNMYLKQAGKEPQRSYYYTYVRKVNGIPFTSNTITVNFDAVYGRITNVSVTWYDLDFPPIDKVVPVTDVYGKLFSDIGLELQYRFQYDNGDSESKPIRKPDTKPEPRLVYVVKPDKPLSFDANTGAIIDGNDQPYKEMKPVEYTDISGNFAENQIAALAQYGVALEGTEFKPAETILQQDFFRLLAKTLNYYFSSDPSKEVDEMYKYLIREKIVTLEEKSPESAITRQDAVKFIIRAMKYDKVADIKGIYNCSFTDAGKIDPSLTGYVAIAAGLNIVKGYSDGSFNPQRKVTRAEAAVMLYNYLQK